MPGWLILQLLGGFMILVAVFGQLGMPATLVGIAVAVVGLVEMPSDE